MMQYNKKLIEFHSYMICSGYRRNKYGQYVMGRWPFKQSGCWLAYPTSHTIYVVGLNYEEAERLKTAYVTIFGLIMSSVDICTMDKFRYYCWY